MTRTCFVLPLALAVTAMIGCSSDAPDPRSEPPPPMLVDSFTSATGTLTLTARPIGDAATDFLITVDLTDDSAGTTQAVSYDTRNPSKPEMEALYNLIQSEPALALAAQHQLAERGHPAAPQDSAWLAVERTIVGMAVRTHVEQPAGDGAYEAADSCGPFGSCTWEYCAGDGYDHCCCFDHGCGWLCWLIT
jgi:hypothetical protein